MFDNIAWWSSVMLQFEVSQYSIDEWNSFRNIRARNTEGENPIQFPSDWLNSFSIVCVSAVIAVCSFSLQLVLRCRQNLI